MSHHDVDHAFLEALGMKKIWILAGLVLALFVVGCSKSQATPAPENANAEGSVAGADGRRAVGDDLASCVLVQGEQTMTSQQWADASNQFALAMLSKLPDSRMTVFSPYSIERAVGMVYEGACGETATEIRKALAMPDATNISLAGAEIETLMTGHVAPEMTLAIDNRVWVEKAYTLMEDYVRRVDAAYHAQPVSLDFSGDPEGSRKKINDDVALSTKDRIRDLLPPGAIDIVTRLILTNAVYFKAPWKDAFSPDHTVDAEFRGSAANSTVRMMHHSKNHRVYMDDAFVAFDMDFIADNYTFMVVLPTLADGMTGDGALRAVEEKLSAEKIREIRAQMENVKVNLSIPKFKIESDMKLAPMLRSLGMNLAFGDADFRGINGGRDLRIAEVIHKAFIEVAEEGAEAAAATAVLVKTRSLRPQERSLDIVVDHPFFFAILEKSTGTALFVGHVKDL